jgi:ribose/xylose/arabinose/galactoside ABC-type transport system permease subunit
LNTIMQQLGPDQRWLILPPGAWIMIVLTTLVALGLRYTKFGRHIFAIGSNELTAWRCGTSLRNTIMPFSSTGQRRGFACPFADAHPDELAESA